MEILAKLYKSAERHLTGDNMRWNRFIEDFSHIAGARGSIYVQEYSPDSPQARKMTVIAARADDPIHRYVSERMFEHEIMRKQDMPPLEPQRLSDLLGGRALRDLSPPLAAFMEEVGVRHIIAVPAHLGDERLITLIAWRRPGHEDFSDLEKQRLALFMRHLMALLDEADLTLRARPEADVAAFGEKWGLTPAETALLGALLQGLSLRQVAAQSGRSYGTVRWHMQNILGKCQVGSQRELLSEFYRLIRH